MKNGRSRIPCILLPIISLILGCVYGHVYTSRLPRYYLGVERIEPSSIKSYSSDVYENTILALSHLAQSSQFRGMLTSSPEPEFSVGIDESRKVIRVSVRSSSPEIAISITNVAADSIVKISSEWADSNPVKYCPLRRATLPSNMIPRLIYPNYRGNLILFSIIGLMIGLAGIAIWSLIQKKIYLKS